MSRVAHEIDVLISLRVDGIYSNGTAGEFHAQTEDEFDRISLCLATKCNAAEMPFQIGVSHMSAQRWTDQMQTDLPAVLEVESRIRKFMDGHIAPYITEQRYCNAACDRFMANIGGWADVGERMRWPYRSIR